MNLEIQEFGNNIIQDTYKKWIRYKNQYDIWDYGFGVFYSPIYYHPDLMIIGYNLGGCSKDFSVSKSLVIPEEHEYFTDDYKLAKVQKNIWESFNQIEILQKSVKLNLNFFRSRTIAQWKTVPKTIRTDLESFCVEKVREIIFKLNPSNIMAEGIKTYDELLWKIFGLDSSNYSSIEVKNKRMRIFTKCLIQNMNILGTAHLSGCRLSKEDIKLISNNLNGFFKKSIFLFIKTHNKRLNTDRTTGSA